MHLHTRATIIYLINACNTYLIIFITCAFCWEKKRVYVYNPFIEIKIFGKQNQFLLVNGTLTYEYNIGTPQMKSN